MVLDYLFLIVLLIGVGAWAGYNYLRQGKKILELNQSIHEANQQLRKQQDLHDRDRTRWEQSEEKLRSFLQLMDTLLNTIPNPIYFKDAEGYFQGCNKVYAKQILGLTRDRIIGRRPQELPDQIPADLAAAYLREERKMTEKAGFHTHEAQVQRADGERRDFLFSLAPLTDKEGEQNGSVAVLSDLTEKNRAAQNQIQKEKLEGVLETAGAVCHELNQPLQTLSGYTELLAMQFTESDALANIEKITAQIERMRDITDKLQGITRYETTDYFSHTKIIDIHKASENK